MFPTDAKLLNRARERLVRLAKKLGVSLRQSYVRVGKLALIKHRIFPQGTGAPNPKGLDFYDHVLMDIRK